MTARRLEDPLRIRYAAKLAANGFGLGVGAVTQSIVARSLGPGAYGSYSFLMSFFSQALGFFEMGTSMGFYTKLSQRPSETAIVRFYWLYTLAVGGGLAALTAIVFLVGGTHWLWPGQINQFIWLALGLSVFLSLSQILNQMLDGHGLTVAGEMSRNKQRIIGLGLLGGLAWMGALNLKVFFLYNYLSVALLWWFWVRDLGFGCHAVFPRERLSLEEVRSYTTEFYRYASPLAVYALSGVGGNLLDRWLLQSFSGSVQQGFYGFAFQLAGLAFLFTGSMTPLLTRELAVAFAADDLQRMKFLFSRSVKILYSVAACLGLFFAVAAPEWSYLFGGRDFKDAHLVFGLMMFYPLHQTIGQLSGSVFYATSRTKAYRNLGTVVILLGLPVSYFLLAPQHLGGLHMGALGLVVKMVGLQILGVNLLLWHNARTLDLSFGRLLWHQGTSTLGFGAAAVVAAFLGRPLAHSTLGRLGWIGVIYFVLVFLALKRFPGFMGFGAEDLKWFMGQVREWSKRGRKI
jgi:O-antigen/teichoic acid export membrane protein